MLAKTQGSFLTSIKGIGIILAAGVTAEIGVPFGSTVGRTNWFRMLASYPRVKQTGGSQGPSITSRVSKRSNHILKDFVVQSAFHIGSLWSQGFERMIISRREAAGQHADFGIARRFVRMAMCMMRTSQVYLPPEMRSTHIEAWSAC